VIGRDDRWSTDQLIAMLQVQGATEELSAASGHPLVVVGLDHKTGPLPPSVELSGLVERLRTVPAVVVAIAADGFGGRIGDWASLFDVVISRPDAGLDRISVHGDSDSLDQDDAVGQIATTVAAAPIASVSFAMLLRDSATRSIGAGLAAESAVYSALQSGPEFARWRANRPRRDLHPDIAPPVLVEVRGESMVITLNRPHKRNALNRAMRDAWCDALSQAHDTGLDVTINGAGPVFCAGGDLDEFGTFDDPASAHVVRLTRSVARQLAGRSAHIEVHLHGAAVGSGIELAAFAGRVVATRSTIIGLPEVPLGLVPGAGGTVSIPRRIGRHRCAYLGLSATPIDAVTAHRWGLVDALTDE
jgi:hypothetical protein